MKYDDLVGLVDAFGSACFDHGYNLEKEAETDDTDEDRRRDLLAAIQALQRDALRYRWLRDIKSDDDYRVYVATADGPRDWHQLFGMELDAAIDEAMQHETDSTPR